MRRRRASRFPSIFHKRKQSDRGAITEGSQGLEQEHSRRRARQSIAEEESMRKLATLFLLALWVIPVVAIRGTAQDQDKKAKMNSAKTARRHGVIIRSNKDESTFTVRRQNVDKTVQYDSSTKWTHL